MDWHRLSPAVIDVIRSANQFSETLHQEHIGDDQILVTILNDESAEARELWALLAVDPAALREAANRICEVGPHRTTGKFPIGPVTKAVLNSAISMADETGYDLADLRHVLIGMLITQDGRAGQLLRSHGLTARKVLETL